MRSASRVRLVLLAMVAGVLAAAATATAAPPSLIATSPPSINGTAQQGFALHETHGSYAFNNGATTSPVTPQSFTYQWTRCDTNGSACVNIAGATGRNYTLTAADVGHTIRVLETASYRPPSSSTTYTATGRSAHTSVVTPPGGPAVTVTTGNASNRTTTRATLNGTVNTANAQVTWQFQYGQDADYNKGTPVQTIGSGRGNVPVTWTLKHLRPNTQYHYRLVAVFVNGGQQTTVYGVDRTFTTKTTGKFLLLSRRLKVSGGTVAVPLKCQSALKCVSQFTITGPARIVKGKTGATIVCAVKTVRLNPGQRKTVHPRVRTACLARLNAAKTHQINGKFTARPRTGQSGQIKRVVLFL